MGLRLRSSSRHNYVISACHWVYSSSGLPLWSKAYARAGGPVPAPSVSDKGRVSCISCSTQPDATFSSIYLAFHIILNFVVGVILVAFLPSLIMKPNVSSATPSLFWSSAFIGAPFALIFILTKLYAVISTMVAAIIRYPSENFHNEAVYMSTEYPLLLLLTVELIVAILRSKRSVLAIPRCMGYCCSFCCFCCFCCCCRPGGRSHSRVARALALWFVIGWLQLIAASVVPVTIVVLTTSPLLVLATLAMVVSALFGMVVFLAVLIHMCSQHDRSKCWILFIYSIILVGVFVKIGLAFLLLLLTVVHGGEVNSIPAFIGTLVPSAILSIVTWLVKVKVLGKKPTEADPSSERPERLQEEVTQDDSTALL